MKIHQIKTGTVAAVFIALLLQGGPPAASQSCTENTGLFTETFGDASDLDLAASSVQYWYNHPTTPHDYMTLNKVGANFGITNPTYIPAWINALTTNDFDLDGWQDYVGTSSSYSNVLAFVRNLGAVGQVGRFDIGKWIDGSTGDASGWPLRGVGGAAIDGSGHNGMTSGDYDGDGDFDFLAMVSETSGSTPIKRIWLYENTLIKNGVNTGVLNFTRTDLTAAWTGLVKGIAWSSTMMVSCDLDGDGDIDIVLGNKDGEVLKITNTGNGLVNAQTFLVESTPLAETGWGGRGVSTVAVADFDGSPGLDIIVGSVSNGVLWFYENDGTGHFTYVSEFTDTSGDLHNNMYDGAATVSLAYDFDRDGDQDLIVGTDNWNYGGDGYGGKCYYFKNGGTGNFVVSLIFDGPTKSPSVYDFDLGAVFDFDNDGDMDFLIADGNDSEFYYVFVNTLADVYNTKGVAFSLNLTPTLLSVQYAITKARLTRIDQRVLGGSSTGLAVDYYVSNNGGRNWEFYAQYADTDLINHVNEPWHSFQTFGADLRWKAVFSADADSMPQYDDASFETPCVDTIGLEYVYVERREYSRSSAAVSTEIGGDRKKLLISASFMFPGLEGQLRAYDVTNIPMVSSAGSSIQTISSSDHLGGRYVTPPGSILWDAGTLLQSRTQASRTVYAGYKTSSTAALQRVDFTEANVGLLGPRLQDVDGDNAGLIRFIRGENRDWKLGDILHSSPVVLGPPSGDPVAMGAGYAAFVSANESRPSVIFLGANDGMLHCFNTSTGQEMWAFIPYNLLPKLKNLSRKDPLTGDRLIAADLFVDGVPVVGDAYINGSWRTILVCGQGAGKGSSIGGGLNYYFALDVTDPLNPLTLWEMRETYMGEPWSVPAFGQVTQSTTTRWVAFMGSGYDNDPARVVGNRFYVVRLDTGAIICTVTAANINTNSSSHPRRFTDIYNAIPGSPTAVDFNRDGKTEYVYVGDLDGRLYRVDVTSTNTSNWKLQAVYTDRLNYPIITKPAAWLDPTTGGLPLRIFFGTGGDDRAPADRPYSIVAVKDAGSSQVVEWYLGDTAELGLPAASRVGGMEIGEKIWADPVISDSIVYFSSLKGSIENVNPCLNLGDLGLLYARFVQSVSGSLIGGTALKSAAGLGLENIQLASKARKAVTVGDQQRAGGVNKREVYVQEYDSTIERLEQPIQTTALRVISWREIYKIIR
jgi:hypothetical protein